MNCLIGVKHYADLEKAYQKFGWYEKINGTITLCYHDSDGDFWNFVEEMGHSSYGIKGCTCTNGCLDHEHLPNNSADFDL